MRHQLAISHNSLGTLLRELSRPREAETACTTALDIEKRLFADFPNRSDFQRELANAQNNLGLLWHSTNRFNEAATSFAEALEQRKQLVANDPKTPDYHNDLAATLVNFASLENSRRDFSQARRLLEEAEPHHLAALKASPAHSLYREFYRKNLSALTRSCAGEGERTTALQTARKIAELGWDRPNNACDAARALATCVLLAETDTKANAPERMKAMQFYADAAMSMLREAISRGYSNFSQVAKDTAFNSLRQREDFKKILAELQIPR